MQKNLAQNTGYVGTSVYMAPEVTRGHEYSHKCDVFSFAIIAYEVLFDTVKPYLVQEFNIEQQVARGN